MGIFDLPASIKYVANISEKSEDMVYIGHSMGTTMFFVYASVLDESRDYVKAMIALAPVAFMGEIKSPVKYIAPYINQIEVSKLQPVLQFVSKIYYFSGFQNLWD